MLATIKYIALGASDATGIGATPLSNGYVFRIARDLRSDSERVFLLNLGINRATTNEVVNKELPLANKKQADIVTVFVGGNDILRGRAPQAFEADLEVLLSSLAANKLAKIFIATLPDLTKVPLFQNDYYRHAVSAILTSYNSVITRLALTHKAFIVDLYNEPLTRNLVSSIDGFHPSNDGHEVIARAYLRVIRKHIAT